MRQWMLCLTPGNSAFWRRLISNLLDFHVQLYFQFETSFGKAFGEVA